MADVVLDVTSICIVYKEVILIRLIVILTHRYNFMHIICNIQKHKIVAMHYNE